MRLRPDGELLLNTTTDAGDYKLQVSGNAYVTGTTVLAATSGNVGVGTASPAYKLDVSGTFRSSHAGGILRYEPETISGSLTSHFNLRAYTTYNNQLSFTEIGVADRWSVGTRTGDDKLYFSQGATVGGSVRMMLNTSAELLLNTTTDAGDYKLQVSGNAYVTGTTVLAATTGRVGIATTTPGANSVLDVNGNLFIRDTARINFRNSQTNLGSYTIGYSSTSPRFPIRLVLSEDPTNQRYFEVGHYTGDNIANTWNPQILMNAWNGSMSLGSGTAPVASAQLEVTSTTKGFLPPRMTTTQRDAISSPAAGLVIYNTTTSKLQVYTTSWTDLH
jgi:hypothetical protein